MGEREKARNQLQKKKGGESKRKAKSKGQRSKEGTRSERRKANLRLRLTGGETGEASCHGLKEDSDRGALQGLCPGPEAGGDRPLGRPAMQGQSHLNVA